MLGCHHHRLRESLDFDHRECFFLTAGIRNVDDLALQLIFAMKFHQDLHRLGYVGIANPKIDPTVSHIILELWHEQISGCRLLGASLAWSVPG
jgi:hypothetical protein